MTDNVFELFRQRANPKPHETDENGKAFYYPCGRDHGDTQYDAVHVYLADRTDLLVYYNHISAVIAPSDTTLYIITLFLVLRVSGRNLLDLMMPLQYRGISAFGCWNAEDFAPEMTRMQWLFFR